MAASTKVVGSFRRLTNNATSVKSQVQRQAVSSARSKSRPNQAGNKQSLVGQLLPLIGLIIISVTNQLTYCQARALTKDFPVGTSSPGITTSGSSLQPELALYGYVPQQQPMDTFAADKAPMHSSGAQDSAATLDRTLNYAIEIGCRNFADTILAAQSAEQQLVDSTNSAQQQKRLLANLSDPRALEVLELIEQQARTKKASPKHTPRFG